MVARNMREFGRMMEMIHVLIAVVATQLYTFVKTHQTIYLQWVDFNIYTSISLTLKNCNGIFWGQLNKKILKFWKNKCEK